MACGVAAVLRLPLTAVVIGTVLTAKAGAGVEPLIIVGVVVTYVVTLSAFAAPPAQTRRMSMSADIAGTDGRRARVASRTARATATAPCSCWC